MDRSRAHTWFGLQGIRRYYVGLSPASRDLSPPHLDEVRRRQADFHTHEVMFSHMAA